MRIIVVGVVVDDDDTKEQYRNGIHIREYGSDRARLADSAVAWRFVDSQGLFFTTKRLIK